MLYSFLKIWVGAARYLFCRKIVVNKPQLLQLKGPLLLACNHPNSFLDSVILDILFKEPVWSLARGDVFINPKVNRLLNALKILPVYRNSEGPENVPENYKTFEACIDLFKQNGVVQIFSEGRCKYEWRLRPLKKGTARLAISAWQQGIPLRVLPVGINYSSFSRFGKNIFICFGDMITADDVDLSLPDGLRHQAFNEKLRQQLVKLVFEIDKEDKYLQKTLLVVKPSLLKKIILLIPAVAGWLLHAPLYYPARAFVKSKPKLKLHYDSVLNALLMFKYPFYVLFITLLVLLLVKSWWAWLLPFVLPFTAWSYVQVKGQLDG
jgi:1-acyl-sn-glycerol-3-phosphate acyltransferase